MTAAATFDRSSERGREGITARPPEADGLGAVERLAVAGMVVAVVGVCTQSTAHLVNALAFDGRFSGLDAGADNTAFDWASSSLAVAAAASAAVESICLADARMRRAALAGVIAFLSLDDSIGLHDRLEHVAGGLGAVAAAPVLGLALVLLVDAAGGLPARGRVVLLSGIALLVAGVLGRIAGWAIERAASADPSEWVHATGVVLVQDADLAAWALVAAALAGGLVSRLAGLSGERGS